MNTVIFHIDVNSAFLSWSASDRIQKGIYPDLRTIPSVVGGNKKERRGIVLASSMPAKNFGIVTGEEIFKAYKKCKDLYVIPPDFNLYSKCSNKLYEICERFSPSIEMFSIDELFLDYTNMEMHFGSPIEGARKIQDTVFRETGVTVNIGISSNKLLAKMASDFEKPNKIHTLFPDEVESKMWHLPVSSLLMIGKKTSAKLNSLGIKTIGQLANADEDFLTFHFKTQGKIMKAYANGIDISEIQNNNEEVKSISNGITVSHNINYPQEADPVLLSLCEKVCYRMRKKNFRCSLLTLYAKDKNFIVKSHCIQLPHPVFSVKELYKYSKHIFNILFDGTPIRALTVSISRFSDINFLQYNFFDNFYDETSEAIDKSIDEIRKIYGYNSVTRASLLKNKTAQMIAKGAPLQLSSKL